MKCKPKKKRKKKGTRKTSKRNKCQVPKTGLAHTAVML